MNASMVGRCIVIGLAAAIAILGMLSLRTARNITAELHPPQKALEPRDHETARALLPRLEDVWLQTIDGRRLAAWYVPSLNGAAVIFAHGSGDNRADVLPEARHLAEHGYGILAFEWRNHEPSAKEICTFGDRERADFEAALEHVSQREDVKPGRIGAMGHSVGATAVALVAAKDPRVSAVVLSATTPSLREGAEYELRSWGPIGVYPALWTLRYHGLRIEEVDARQAVASQTRPPWPLLVIGGSEDPYVPRAMTDSLYASARAPKELYVVEGAGHGHYVDTAGTAYLDRLLVFFDSALTAHEMAVTRHMP